MRNSLLPVNQNRLVKILTSPIRPNQRDNTSPKMVMPVVRTPITAKPGA